jgi:hypothetical protein
MSVPFRVAGWGTLDDGAVVTWTIAEGRRGRRWREIVTRGDAVSHSLLLETDADRRFSHLELARVDGLWTFHPEGDGTLHGNHVDAAAREVHHVVGMPFGGDDLLVIEGSPLGAAAIAWRLAVELTDGETSTFAAVILPAAGSTAAVPAIRVQRVSASRWRIGAGDPFEIDADGAPVLPGGEVRPLELA